MRSFDEMYAHEIHRLQSEVDRLTAENRALRTRYEGKPAEPGGKGYCRGACEYRELTAENKAMREALTQCAALITQSGDADRTTMAQDIAAQIQGAELCRWQT